MFIRAGLGVVLLSDVSFKSTYREVQTFPVIQAGLSSMNTSLLQNPSFAQIATSNFWWHFPAMMSYSFPISPVTCAGADCQSFYFPGPIGAVIFPPNATEISSKDSPEAGSLIEKNAPGYQIEFGSQYLPDDLPLSLDDCRVFGIPFMAVQLCLKTASNLSIVAGTTSPMNTLTPAWSACPPNLAKNMSCMSSNDWRTTVAISTKMTVSRRHASTVFDRQNFTVMDVTDLSTPIPIAYRPDILFSFYEKVMNFNLSSPGSSNSVQYSFLLSLSSYLQHLSTAEGFGGAQRLRIQEFLAAPIVIYNDAWLARQSSDADMGNALVLAVLSYRVTPSLTPLIIVAHLSYNTEVIHRRRFHHADLVSLCPRIFVNAYDS